MRVAEGPRPELGPSLEGISRKLATRPAVNGLGPVSSNEGILKATHTS